MTWEPTPDDIEIDVVLPAMKPKSVRQLTDQIVVRIDPDLRARLEADAEENERTAAQSVRYHLRHSLPEVPDAD